MTLPKKASRAIEVKGKSFRWMVKSTVDKDRVRLTVENTETGETKQTFFRGYHIDGGDEDEPGDAPAVTPGDVKGFIIECWF